MDKAGEQEKPNSQEIPLDKQTARALGNGLKQIFTDNLLRGILKNAEFLKEKLTEDVAKEDASIIGRNVNRVSDFLKAFGESKKVSLVSDESGCDFKFSKDKEPGEKPQQGEIIFDENISKKIRGALNHNLRNIFMPILGFAGIINTSSKDLSAKEKSEFIVKESNSMIGKFASVNQEGYQIRLLTDTQGITTISQIPIK